MSDPARPLTESDASLEWLRFARERDKSCPLVTLSHYMIGKIIDNHAALLAHRAQLVELAEKWRRQFPVSALKACDDYYTGEAHGTLKCLKQVDAVLASGEGRGQPHEEDAESPQPTGFGRSNWEAGRGGQ